MLTDIDQSVQARICAPGARDHDVTATLRYHHDDPLAAYVTFPAAVSADGAEVTWTFARNLLAAGLRGPAGDGDVHVWPCGPDSTMIELRAPEGTALVQIASAAVSAFLSRAYEAVPAGREVHDFDVDVALTALLDGEI
ncbi:SsgA family sporulation/cell division regulator [Actinacidiphila oryziradicis]|uniref:SsgA family sporulation/cell division regulator n=1 Tax=Actinacidiphila oryziradicis TaxID=2571141 RepID=A0A4V5N003_9ACTN|nr:SsgA family sporulation/cell division regulator [Actinacidiphila oryziradicis]TKA09879.1 SsgA family sporulation/cell division regulator [Actinacidiphila oryziradicis]